MTGSSCRRLYGDSRVRLRLERVEFFHGGYDAWVVERSRARAHAEEDHQRYEERRADLAAQAQHARESAGRARAARRPTYRSGRVDRSPATGCATGPPEVGRAPAAWSARWIRWQRYVSRAGSGSCGWTQRAARAQQTRW